MSGRTLLLLRWNGSPSCTGADEGFVSGARFLSLVGQSRLTQRKAKGIVHWLG